MLDAMKYKLKDTTVEAFKWTGGHDQTDDPQWAVDAIKADKLTFTGGTDSLKAEVHTRSGLMIADPGDWIVRDEKGMFVVTDEEFTKNYKAIS